MGKLIKKNTTGSVKNFMTRNQALKKLQISLADFRRLCILKGIYPRDPKHKRKLTGGSGALTTFYHAKDILHVLHEPILSKLREYKTFAKKLSKFIGKKEWSTAKKFEQNKPVYTLDHVVKERYPTFNDALRDLDDALCHLFLFASLPRMNGYTERISRQCMQLCHEFMHYVMVSHGLRKAFLSIKGIYYQAEVCGQTISWLSPYEFSQYVPPNVDFRVMLTFLEFYQNLIGFVNYKLFTDLDYCYPPTVDVKLETDGAALMSLRLESTHTTALAPLPLVNSTTTLLAQDNNVGFEMASKIKELEAKMPLIVSHDQQIQEQAKSNDLHASQAANLIDSFQEAPKKNEDEDESENAGSLNAMHGSTSNAIQEKSRDMQIVKTLFSEFVIFLSREVPRDALIFAIRCFGGRVGWAHTISGSPFAENDSRITHQISDRPVQTALYTGRVYVQPQWVYDCLNQRKILKVDLYAPGVTLPPHYSPFVTEESEDPLKVDDEEENELSLAQTLTEVEKSMAKKSYEHEYKQQLEAEAKGVSFSSYQESEKEPVAKVSTKTLKHLETKEMEKEQKEMALSMMSKKKRKLYEAMQRGIHNKKMESDRLKSRRILASKQAKQTR